MHNAALVALGMGDEWRYEAIEVAPDRFETRVRAMGREGFAGANVTVPHKGAALAVADELSGVAREIGAANTLVFGDGEIRAENTDADGLLNALPSSPRGAGFWCSVPGVRAAPQSGHSSARAPRLRCGIEPSCALTTSARNWADGRRPIQPAVSTS